MAEFKTTCINLKTRDLYVLIMLMMMYLSATACVFQIYFGASVARYYLAFHTLGISCFTGMSYLVKKEELDAFGGLSWFGRFLAEDFFIAKYLHEKLVASLVTLNRG